MTQATRQLVGICGPRRIFLHCVFPIAVKTSHHPKIGGFGLFEIGVFYHAIKQYQEALTYYEQSEPYIGEQFSLRYNVALCQHQLGRNDEALVNFKKSLELNPDSKEAEEWIAYLEKQDKEQS